MFDPVTANFGEFRAPIVNDNGDTLTFCMQEPFRLDIDLARGLLTDLAVWIAREENRNGGRRR